MTVSRHNRHMVIFYSSVFAFVLLIAFAYALPGAAGNSIAAGITFPLKRPLLIAASLSVGWLAGIRRHSALFAIPISYCLGMMSGMMLQASMHLSVLVGSLCAVSLILWLLFTWLCHPARHVEMQAVLVAGMGIGVIHTFPAALQNDAFFAFAGLLLSVMLLVASGVCLMVTLAGGTLRWSDLKSAWRWPVRSGMPRSLLGSTSRQIISNASL